MSTPENRDLAQDDLDDLELPDEDARAVVGGRDDAEIVLLDYDDTPVKP